MSTEPNAPAAPSMRLKVWRLLEAPDDFWGHAISALLVAMILANAAAVVIGTVETIEARYGAALSAFETLSVLVFAVEYGARLWASAEAGPRWRWAVTPLAIIDLVAILPFFLGALFALDLRQLRILRLLRLAKLSRHFAALDVLITALRAEAGQMAAAMAIMAGLIVLSASFVYEAEHLVQPDAFGDIPQAMWWAAVTLTTVGYGDVAPVTPIGKAIAVVVMTCGVGMVALPAGMLASRFSDELATRRRAYASGISTTTDEEAREALRESLGLSEEDADRVEQARQAEDSVGPKAAPETPSAEPVGRCPHCGAVVTSADLHP